MVILALGIRAPVWSVMWPRMVADPAVAADGAGVVTGGAVGAWASADITAADANPAAIKR